MEAGDGTADAVTLAVSTAMAADNDATYFKLASGDDSGSFSVNNGTGSLSYTGNSNKLRFDYSSSPDNSLTVKLQGYNFDSAGTLAITEVR